MKTLRLISYSLLFVAASTHAQVYQWRDDQGKLHFSDKPPKKTEATQRDVSVPNIGFISPAKKTPEKPEPKADKKPEPIEKDPVKCAQAKESLPILQGNTRIRTDKGNGEIAYLTIDEINQQIELAQKIIEVHCE